MNIRTPLIRAAFAAVLIGGVCALPRIPYANAAPVSVTMSVDAVAPLHATLLPTVSVFAGNPQRALAARIATTEALPVTLLPTVHVHARWSQFAATALSGAQNVAVIDYAHGARVAATE
ncbi:MAG: hypothetical protein ACHP7D_01295 [Lysobacterales bacterium]